MANDILFCCAYLPQCISMSLHIFCFPSLTPQEGFILAYFLWMYSAMVGQAWWGSWQLKSVTGTSHLWADQEMERWRQALSLKFYSQWVIFTSQADSFKGSQDSKTNYQLGTKCSHTVACGRQFWFESYLSAPGPLGVQPFHNVKCTQYTFRSPSLTRS